VRKEAMITLREIILQTRHGDAKGIIGSPESEERGERAVLGAWNLLRREFSQNRGLEEDVPDKGGGHFVYLSRLKLAQRRYSRTLKIWKRQIASQQHH